MYELQQKNSMHIAIQMYENLQKKMACKYMDASRKMACILQFKYKDASRKIACILQNVMHLVIKRSLVYGRKIRNWWKYLPLFAFQLERVINILRSNSLFSNSCF